MLPPRRPPPHILVINGPNMTLLGTRQPQIYGDTGTFPALMASLRTLAAAKLACTLSTFQSNHEGALVERIHDVPAQGVDMVVINAGAYTHTSVAIRDALLGVGVPFVEVHVSNVHAREDFRCRSYLSDVAVGVVCGLGTYGYEAAVEFAVRHVAARPLASSSSSSPSPSSSSSPSTLVERSSA